MFSFFKKLTGAAPEKEKEEVPAEEAPAALPEDGAELSDEEAFAAAEAAEAAALAGRPVKEPPPEAFKEDAPAKEAAPEAAGEPAAEEAEPEEKVYYYEDFYQDSGDSWFSRLKEGLARTSASFNIFGGTEIDEFLYEDLETALLLADAGIPATEYLMEQLREAVRENRLTKPEEIKQELTRLITELLKPLEKPLEIGRYTPLVMMMAGVNGAGKTTTIGKLARHLQNYGQTVLLAAGDTFRAAAREQLAVWGDRNKITVIAQTSGDPAAVAFDAVQSAKAKNTDVVMVDTAGRLPTQLHLMEELKKVKRVIGKGMEKAPHETILVIDGNTGQNALAQVKAFDDALNLTGLIITKLDGTPKGGILAAIAKVRPVPVYFIGVGEKIEDLQPFKAEEFAKALLN